MVLDYSERKPVGKNRPRKQPVGMFVLLLIGAVSTSYVLGLTTGWFLFKARGKSAQGQTTSVAPGPAAGGATAAQQPPFSNPDATASRGGDPPLTFYETLPKGGKAVIGSGLNPTKPGEPPVLKPAAPAQKTPQAVKPPPVPSPDVVAPEATKEKASPPVEQPKKVTVPSKEARGTYCVQVASSQDRKEAETLKASLMANGLPAYVVESKIKDKGTWYRVRIGRHLSQQAAGELADKAGKRAMVVPE